MRKTVALFIVFFANILLLAHEITDYDCLDTGAASVSHAQNEDCVDDNYILSRNGGTTVESYSKGFPGFRVSDFGQSLFVLIISALNIRDLVDNTFINFQHTPYLAAFLPDQSPQLPGLRAPPVC